MQLYQAFRLRRNVAITLNFKNCIRDAKFTGKQYHGPKTPDTVAPSQLIRSRASSPTISQYPSGVMLQEPVQTIDGLRSFPDKAA